jgi:hypothetical protein
MTPVMKPLLTIKLALLVLWQKESAKKKSHSQQLIGGGPNSHHSFSHSLFASCGPQVHSSSFVPDLHLCSASSLHMDPVFSCCEFNSHADMYLCSLL